MCFYNKLNNTKRKIMKKLKWIFMLQLAALSLSSQAQVNQSATPDEEDFPEVREESFRYHGPKPQTRECAIVSLADSIESASRSMEKTTPHRIDQLVEEMIQKRLAQGELKECDLRLNELAEVAESFKRTLRSMMHSRIAYPKSTPKRESHLLERNGSGGASDSDRRERHG
jgi:membrane-associated HD superfamily phosphohydrolase